MKLAVVVDTFPRWSERFIARELTELARRGIDTTVFCLKVGSLPEGGGSDPDFAGILSRNSVIPAVLAVRSARVPAGAELARREGLARAELGAIAVIRIRRARFLAQMLSEGRFDHVHAHFASLPSTLAWLAGGVAPERRLTLSVHARDLFVEPQLLAHKLHDCSHIFTCHGRGLENLTALARGANSRARIILMRHGLPLEQFPFAQRSTGRWAQRGVKLLAVGRFVPKKGFHTLLHALANPSLAAAKITATLIGDGPGLTALQTQIEQLKLRDRVVLRPPANSVELQAICADCDLFVAPYETAADGDSDGVPNTILEAFALGLPVVGTQAGSVGEVLTTQTGSVVPEKEPVALAQAIAAFIDSPRSAFDTTRAARALVDATYDIRKNIEPLVQACGGEGATDKHG